MQDTPIDSVAYSRLISWIAYFKFGVLLNKVQMQKILFIAYGMYLAFTGELLFTDDTPKAWPLGPVFPRVFNRFDPAKTPKDFSDEQKDMYRTNRQALVLVYETVIRYHKCSAEDLSDWSHDCDGPWRESLKVGNDGQFIWNAEIGTELIKRYFEKTKWPIIA